MVSRFTNLESHNDNTWLLIVALICICVTFGFGYWMLIQLLHVPPAHGETQPINRPVAIRQRTLEYMRAANPNLTQQEYHEISTAIMMASVVHKIPVGLIVALCHVESNFRCKAVGPKVKGGRAIGLMQVLWPTHQGLASSRNVKEADMYTPVGGIDIGCVLLSGYVREEKSIIGALGRYLGQNSRAYILEKVIAGWLAFESGVPIEVGHKQEVSNMKKLVRGR